MTISHRTQSRIERQRELNLQLSVLPTFTPLNHYQVYHINQNTPAILLQDLVELAKTTKRFTIDTEQDCYTNQAALIQIEFIRTTSIVLLIETCHLPSPSSILFWLIKSLLKVILSPSHVIYGWGDVIDELTDFVQYGLFSSSTIHQLETVDIQYHFKQWYNRRFQHTCLFKPFEDDHVLCTCAHRPVKDKNNKWSLQKAIAYTFHEFLDKSRTRSRWSRSLDLTNARQFASTYRRQQEICQELVLYAANDCLAATKLLMLLGLE